MRKTILALVGVLAFATAACGSQSDDPAPVGTSGYTESAAPSPALSADPAVDYTKDVTDLTWKARPADVAPEGDQAELSFTITNHGKDAAYYTVVFAVYDASGAQTTAIGVDTQNSGYGPTQPGGVLKVSGPWGTTDGAKVPNPFSVKVQSVDKIPAGA